MNWTEAKDGLPSKNGYPWNIEVLVAEWDDNHECYDYFVASVDFEHNVWKSVPIYIQGPYPICEITRDIRPNHKWQYINGL